MDIQLTVGEQSTAAQTVQTACTTFQEFLQSLSDSLETDLTGFQGNAAVAFGTAVSGWFESAATLVPALQSYAEALAGVDAEHAPNDVQVASTMASLTSRLGGGAV
ncbi:WXG100 family type VII secretion target [Nocardioides sp. ChNu-153]|uniref:WXG100 family type VII secretion target n=1 Tax=unclassified Nocardioides TaxID=2615069 RepID=UPI002406AEBE|nr:MULTISPECIES: WXG100 family type VII secretion target [unclassified Nocardioides]MDF9715870.1 WXG100 family type VII secretion target [Nocardioides sp. ChNu-99]MDN7120971.1 WXG100 family type VII secretion target [Nocardioides sp. ChNu-153]